MNVSTSLRRATTTLAVTTGLLLAGAGAASAHVSVSSPDAEPGGYGKLVFRVPSESDTAKTEKITVTMPTDTPFRSVSTKPVPGWTAELTTGKLPEPVESDGFTTTEAVTEVTWTADPAAALESGEFQEFEMSVGTFPEDVNTLSFPTVQTYTDGEVARWTQPVTEGAAEPESPAPLLELSAATSADAQPASDTERASDAAPASAETGTSDSTDTVARVLGGLGLVLAAVAFAWASMNRRRRTG